MRSALAACAVVGLVLGLAGTPVQAQTPVGYFEGSGDVGSPALTGSTAYDAASQTYTIVGAGTNMWATRDEFQFVWRKMTGDFIVRTHAAFVGTGVDPHRKIGWIVRKSLEADSAVRGRSCTRGRPDVAAVPQDRPAASPRRSRRR